MNEKTLNDYIKNIGISREQILREEAEMEILSELATTKLGAKLVFYGGTAIRLVYNSPRFSEDIDLLVIKKINFLEFKNFAINLTKKHNNWTLKDIKNKRQTMFGLININDDKLKHSFSIKIEAHKPVNKIKIETELSLIKSPLSINEPLLLVPTLVELKKMKEVALLGRKKSRDIFDLWYIAQTLRENFLLPKKLPKYTEREFKNELQVFLPKKYYPIVNQLYDRTKKTNK
ncbi:MAG: nucleotidyl transferase AbiEii/AbiGii toxin family protein [Patescibacteria group bacterium]|nr:nucleotidyl transferase AbiEii/AbiGii toxin family protein [Patescibacteria group bacterium]MBU0879646.1 nucleotidyl transferase AbiEii/AbiGii toxin family protein [Patescibacteria group bacterium]MBU0897967.1 nucleotidyl transferase AbiEii/AbiGii toxin family protein [Patescibacteria group bacterium]MBU1063036.1 nucleotidyl transferase AbiEii/AbiGii toxin family protein [Patescibacteria group bacterium]